jgi:hypothetical protein
MSIWRIRITLPGDPGSQALLDEALAGQPVSQIRLTTRDDDAAELTGDVLLELAHDEELGSLLSALHTISPQVFVSRADPVEPEATLPRPALRRRRLSLLRTAAPARDYPSPALRPSRLPVPGQRPRRP